MPGRLMSRVRKWQDRTNRSALYPVETFEQTRDRMFDEINEVIAKHHPDYVLKMQTTKDPELQEVARFVRIDRVKLEMFK